MKLRPLVRSLVCLAALLPFAACAESPTDDDVVDAGANDSGTPRKDGGGPSPTDAGRDAGEDATTVDGSVDGGPDDGGLADSAVDGGVDAAASDAGPDGATSDAGLDAGASDAGRDSGVVDAGPPPAPACYAEANASVYNAANVSVAAQPGKCTAADITAFRVACFDAGATNASCNGFLASKPTCGACLYTGATDAAGKTILPAVLETDNIAYANVEACEAVFLGNAATCGVSYVNETTCLFSACDLCANADFGSCTNAAAARICGPYVVAGNSACGQTRAANQAAADAACRGADFNATYAKVAAVLCK